MSLEDYDRKRDFELTPEPPSEHPQRSGGPERSEPEASEVEGRFMVHMHDATRLHWDLRLELDGVFKSWAVPKGPSLDPAEKRLAVLVEDHPYEYGEFEGVIPEGNYGAGTTMIWDEGTYTTPGAAGRAQVEGAFHAGLDKGTIKIVLKGTKLEGQFALVRLKDGGGKNWLLIKDRDAFSTPRDILELDRSARTGRSLADIRQEEIGRPRGDRLGINLTDLDLTGARSDRRAPGAMASVDPADAGRTGRRTLHQTGLVLRDQVGRLPRHRRDPPRAGSLVFSQSGRLPGILPAGGGRSEEDRLRSRLRWRDRRRRHRR